VIIKEKFDINFSLHCSYNEKEKSCTLDFEVNCYFGMVCNEPLNYKRREEISKSIAREIFGKKQIKDFEKIETLFELEKAVNKIYEFIPEKSTSVSGNIETPASLSGDNIDTTKNIKANDQSSLLKPFFGLLFLVILILVLLSFLYFFFNKKKTFRQQLLSK
jgi:hypothetical protein